MIRQPRLSVELATNTKWGLVKISGGGGKSGRTAIFQLRPLHTPSEVRSAKVRQRKQRKSSQEIWLSMYKSIGA